MRKKILTIAIPLVILAAVFLVSSYVAVTFFTGNITVFAALTVAFPTLCIMTFAFVIGRLIEWNWKKGLCLALVLVLISYGTGLLSQLLIGDKFQDISVDTSGESLDDNALMQEIYDELDRQAYEYMLEQGLISEGEEIYSGDPVIGERENAAKSDGNEEDNVIVGSEMVFGIQKSDPTTELLGNLLDFILAFGFSFFGYKVKNRKRRAVQSLDKEAS